MAYNFKQMETDGFTPEQIGEAIGFNYGAMKADGYSDEQINQALTSMTPTEITAVPEQQISTELSQDSLSQIQQLEQAKAQYPEHTERYDIAIQRVKDEDIKAKQTEQQAIADASLRDKTLEEAKEHTALKRTVDVAETIGRGTLRPALGLMRAVEETGKLVGLGDETSDVAQWIAENEEEATRLMKKHGYDEEAILNPANLGQIIAEILPLARVSKLGTAIGSEAVMAGLATFGKGEEVGTALKHGAIAGVATGVIGGGIKLANKMFAKKAIPTEFKKKLEALSPSQQKDLELVLDNLDTRGIKALNEDAKKNLIHHIQAGKKSTAELSVELNKTIKSQFDASKSNVDTLYSQADAVAKETDKIEIDKSFIKTVKELSKGAKPQKKAIREIKSILGIKKPKAKKPSVDKEITLEEIFGEVEIAKKPRAGNKYNAFELEGMIQTLKAEQRSATASSGKPLYGKAIDYLEGLKSQVGGDGVYADAIGAYKKHRIDFEGALTGEGTTAGDTVSKVLSSEFTENVAEKLIDGTIDPNKVGAVVKRLTGPQKKQMVQDLIFKDVEDPFTSRGFKQIMANYNKMGNGLEKILSKESAKKLRRDMESLAVIEAHLQKASGLEVSIGKELQDIAVAVSMAKLSPFLAIRSGMFGLKKIASKLANVKSKDQLIKRVKLVDPAKRRELMKLVSIIAGGATAVERFKKIDEEEIKEEEN